MDSNQIAMIMFLGIFAITVLITVWLVKRGTPQKRFFWFISCFVVSIFLIGILQALLSIVLSLFILALIKSENDKPLADVGNGFLYVVGSGIQLSIFGLYMLFGIGGLYWLWLSIQLESFLMFVVGIFPLSFLITAPVGAYSLVVDTPRWVINWFG